MPTVTPASANAASTLATGTVTAGSILIQASLARSLRMTFTCTSGGVPVTVSIVVAFLDSGQLGSKL
ncbi:hypothetical protein D3C72_1391040 [compost metagenome]